jgi:ParB family chromosome partitioning protein
VVEESSSSVERNKEKLCQLSVGLIQSGKYQPRRDMSPEGLEDLTNSIRAQGIIQPIIVRHLLGGRYEIVAGERRWRAAQLAGLTEVPAIVRDIPDDAALAIALIENIQRENLNPIEEAVALHRLLEEFSMTHHQVAEAVGKSRASVTNLLRLLTLTDEVKTMLEHGDLEMGHARALLSLPADLQIDTARAIVNKGLSVREAEDLVRRLQTPTMPGAVPQTVDPDVERLQASLAKRLKLPVQVQHSAQGKGKVVIRYKNIAELNALLEYFQ